jgi:hypothetical protein
MQNARPWQTPEGMLRNPALSPYGRGGPRFYNDLFAYTIAVPSLAPGASTQISQNLESDSAFEWICTTGVSLASGGTVYAALATGPQFSVTMQDGGPSRNLFGTNLSPALIVGTALGNICGTAEFPHVLPVPKRFVPNANILFQVTNTDTAITQQAYITLQGKKVFSPTRDRSAMQGGVYPRFRSWVGADDRMYSEDYFGYSFNLSTIAAGATIRIPLTVDSEADFEWIMATMNMPPRNATTGNNNLVPLINVTVEDGGSRLKLFSGAFPAASLFGNGQTPYILTQPRVFERLQQIILFITNTDTVAYNNMYFLFEGRKVFQGD